MCRRPWAVDWRRLLGGLALINRVSLGFFEGIIHVSEGASGCFDQLDSEVSGIFSDTQLKNKLTRNVATVREKNKHLKPALLYFAGAVEFDANLQLQMSGVKLSPLHS